MKKDFVFLPILLVVGVLLALLDVTGIKLHIVISVVGVIALVAYTVLTKKEWNTPAIEIGMRLSYGLALISGIVLKVKYIAIIGIFHKIFSVLFVVLLIVLFVLKLIAKKNK